MILGLFVMVCDLNGHHQSECIYSIEKQYDIYTDFLFILFGVSHYNSCTHSKNSEE